MIRSRDDIIVWPDDVWCDRSELPHMTHKSDDYRVIPVDTPEWEEFLENNR